MIATLVPSGDDLVRLLVALGFLATLWWALRQFENRGKPEPREVHPQPLIVRPAEEFQTRKEAALEVEAMKLRLARLEESVERFHSELGTLRADLDATDEARASRLHSRVDQLREDLEGRIAAMPERIVALLRNTRNLK